MGQGYSLPEVSVLRIWRLEKRFECIRMRVVVNAGAKLYGWIGVGLELDSVGLSGLDWNLMSIWLDWIWIENSIRNVVFVWSLQ